MSISRRLFGKLAAISPIAAPAAAKEFASHANYLGVADGLAAKQEAMNASQLMPKHKFATWWGKDELKELMEGREKVKRACLRNMRSEHITLDPDLYENRSMSLSAKVHIQRNRRADEAIERRKVDLFEQAKQLAFDDLPPWLKALLPNDDD